MQVDRYTKTALTVIAVCLVLLTLKEYEIVSDAEAQRKNVPMDVRIINHQPLDVNIAKIRSSNLNEPVLPVDLKGYGYPSVKLSVNSPLPVAIDRVGSGVGSQKVHNGKVPVVQ